MRNKIFLEIFLEINFMKKFNQILILINLIIKFKKIPKKQINFKFLVSLIFIKI
jgi:hypothetical protein